MCIRIHLLNFKKQTNKHKKQECKKKQKKLKKKRGYSGKWIKKNKFPAARVKIFLFTHIFGNKGNFLASPIVCSVGLFIINLIVIGKYKYYESQMAFKNNWETFN